MKKLAKLSALLLVAAVFFAGCKEPEDQTKKTNGGGNDGSTFSATFDVSETPVEIASSTLELSDGNWVYKGINIDGENSETVTLELTVTNSEPSATSGTYSQIMVSTKESDRNNFKTKAESAGATVTIEGNKCTGTMELTGEDLSYWFGVFASLPEQYTTFKTNDARTKFYAEKTNTDGTIVKNYLSKK